MARISFSYKRAPVLWVKINFFTACKHTTCLFWLTSKLSMKIVASPEQDCIELRCEYARSFNLKNKFPETHKGNFRRHFEHRHEFKWYFVLYEMFDETNWLPMLEVTFIQAMIVSMRCFDGAQYYESKIIQQTLSSSLSESLLPITVAVPIWKLQIIFNH